METFNQIVNSETPVVVDFYADWCDPCQTMMPIVKEVAEKFKGKARVLKINIDKNQTAAQHYGVRSVPTFMIFKKGEQKWRHSGTIDIRSLERQIESLI
jgi:thioredoxin 1